MKELSIEEKAKRYDEAIEVIRRCETDKYGCVIGIKPSDIFPETKENDGERIRKTLLGYFNDQDAQYTFRGLTNKEVIAWLEKQGEQKPSNKVEPKFKVGDCIVRNGLGTYKIVEVCKSWYEVISYKDGLQYSIGFDDEKNCHLWSKEDIKRGDVIQLGEVTAIFNEHIGNEKCTCYCSIFNGEFEIPINYDDSIYGFYYCSPATKEQRDLLFKKMKEAGFKWYSKKKMLK